MIYKCIDCGRTGFEKSVCVFVYVYIALNTSNCTPFICLYKFVAPNKMSEAPSSLAHRGKAFICNFPQLYTSFTLSWDKCVDFEKATPAFDPSQCNPSPDGVPYLQGLLQATLQRVTEHHNGEEQTTEQRRPGIPSQQGNLPAREATCIQRVLAHTTSKPICADGSQTHHHQDVGHHMDLCVVHHLQKRTSDDKDGQLVIPPHSLRRLIILHSISFIPL